MALDDSIRRHHRPSVAGGVLGILVSVATLLTPGAARADDDTRLGPAPISADAPGTAQKSPPTPHLSFEVAFRAGYSQRAPEPEPVVRNGELSLQLAFGLFDLLEVGVSAAGRLQIAGNAATEMETAGSPALRASLLPLWVYAKLAIPGLRRPHRGDGWGAAVEVAARIPLGGGDSDPRVAVWPRLITDVRTHWGLLIALDIAVPFRISDRIRPTRLALDINAGLSQLLIRRIDLHLFASGRIRIPLGNSYGEPDLLPATVMSGLTFGSPGEAYVQLGAALDVPPLSGSWDRLSWSAFINIGWLLGRARAKASSESTSNPEIIDGTNEARRARPSSSGDRSLIAFPAPKDIDISQAARDATLAVERANRLYLGPALAERGMEALAETVRGTAIGLAVAATLIGATIYFQASMELTLLFLRWLGVGSMSMLAAERAAVVASAFDRFIGTIAIARGDPAMIDKAAREYADAVALVTGAAGETLFFLAAAEGLDPVLQRLEGSNLSQRLGTDRLRTWLADGIRRIKGQTKGGETVKPEAAPPRAPMTPAQIARHGGASGTNSVAGKTPPGFRSTQTWNTSKNAKILRKNVEAARRKNGQPRIGPDEEVHHIEPSTSQYGERGREVLDEQSIDINAAENSVVLKRGEHQKRGLHTKRAIEAVNDRLRRAAKRGGRAAVLEELRQLADQIQNGSFPER